MLLSTNKLIRSILIFTAVFSTTHIKNVNGGHLSRTPHNLSCYHCNSLTDGDSCRYLQKDSAGTQQCKPTQMFCSVILFQYSTDSSEYVFYSTQRHCEETCQDGCSTVGERVKLFLCRSCCNGYLCNYGNVANQDIVPNNLNLFFIISFLLFEYLVRSCVD